MGAPELKEFCFKFMMKNYQALVLDQKGEELTQQVKLELEKYLKL